MSRVIEMANQVIQDYVLENSLQSHLKLKKEQHGQGCGCLNCLKTAVYDLNLWLEFLDLEGVFPRFKIQVTPTGEAEIIQMGQIIK